MGTASYGEQIRAIEELQRLYGVSETTLRLQEQMLTVFNRIASGQDTLIEEIRQLRKELAPKMLDKLPSLPSRKTP